MFDKERGYLGVTVYCQLCVVTTCPKLLLYVLSVSSSLYTLWQTNIYLEKRNDKCSLVHTGQQRFRRNRQALISSSEWEHNRTQSNLSWAHGSGQWLCIFRMWRRPFGQTLPCARLWCGRHTDKQRFLCCLFLFDLNVDMNAVIVRVDRDIFRNLHSRLCGQLLYNKSMACTIERDSPSYWEQSHRLLFPAYSPQCHTRFFSIALHSVWAANLFYSEVEKNSTHPAWFGLVFQLPHCRLWNAKEKLVWCGLQTSMPSVYLHYAQLWRCRTADRFLFLSRDFSIVETPEAHPFVAAENIKRMKTTVEYLTRRTNRTSQPVGRPLRRRTYILFYMRIFLWFLYSLSSLFSVVTHPPVFERFYNAPPLLFGLFILHSLALFCVVRFNLVLFLLFYRLRIHCTLLRTVAWNSFTFLLFARTALYTFCGVLQPSLCLPSLYFFCFTCLNLIYLQVKGELPSLCWRLWCSLWTSSSFLPLVDRSTAL